jgi:hypothetical protein
MLCFLNDLDSRNFDAAVLKAIRRDDGAAARSHLESGRPIYYCDDEFPSGVVREWPSGRKELVHVRHDGSLTVVRQIR